MYLVLNRTYVLVFCSVLFTIITVSSGATLFVIAKNWDQSCIKNRQPTAHFLLVLTMSITVHLDTVALFMVWLGPVIFQWHLIVEWTDIIRNILIAGNLLWFLSLGFFTHRIWMLFYKSLLQKSLEDFNISDVVEGRAAKSLSNFWIMQRHRLGNSMFMSAVWCVIFCAFGAWLMYLVLACEESGVMYQFIPHYYLNSVVEGFVEIFGLSLLFIQKCLTVSDSFSIATELIWTCFVLTISEPLRLLLRFDVITFDTPEDEIFTFIVLQRSPYVIQLLITYYYTWEILSRVKNQRIVLRSKINLKKVLKNKEWYLAFEKQLMQEYSIENLNFLVSCIQYRRMAMFHGNFGFESITDTSFDGENFEELSWRESTQNGVKSESGKIIKMAQDIYDEYCRQGAPQEIRLSKQTTKSLSEKIEKLPNIYGYPDRDIFCEARREVEKFLSEGALKRFINYEIKRSVDDRYQCPQIDGEYGKPFLNSLLIDDCDRQNYK